MLAPKRVKHRKQHRGRGRAVAAGRPRPVRRVRPEVARGRLDHQPPDRGRPYRDDPQDQAWRQGLDQRLPDKPFTKKPAETRMGSGKGSPEGWVAVVKPGRVMFELAGVPEPLAREAMRLAGHKLPVKTKFVTARGPRPDERQGNARPHRRGARGAHRAPQRREALRAALPARHRRAGEHRRRAAAPSASSPAP